jgi:hypothetical protein
MDAMGIVALGLIGLMVIIGLASTVCFILVLVKMFQQGQTGLAIGSIVLTLCIPLGVLLPFIYGWMKAGEWRIKGTMLTWTTCIVLQTFLLCGFFAVGGFGKNANSTFMTVGSSISFTPRP